MNFLRVCLHYLSLPFTTPYRTALQSAISRKELIPSPQASVFDGRLLREWGEDAGLASLKDFSQLQVILNSPSINFVHKHVALPWIVPKLSDSYEVQHQAGKRSFVLFEWENPQENRATTPLAIHILTQVDIAHPSSTQVHTYTAKGETLSWEWTPPALTTQDLSTATVTEILEYAATLKAAVIVAYNQSNK